MPDEFGADEVDGCYSARGNYDLKDELETRRGSRAVADLCIAPSHI
jgi:hypothetical protein